MMHRSTSYRSVAILLFALGLVALGGRSASAAIVLTSSRPVAPAIGFASYYNSYLLVWAEDRGGGTGLDLYGIRVTPSGTPVGAEIPIVVAPGNQSDPTMVFSRQVGEFLVMYTDDSGQGTVGPTPGFPTPGLPLPGTPGLPTPGGPTPPIPPPPPLLSLSEAGAIEPAADEPMQPTAPPPATPVPSATAAGGGTPVPPEVAIGSRDIWGLFVSPGGQPTSQRFAVINSPADETYPDLSYLPGNGRADAMGLVWRAVTGVRADIFTMELTPIGRFFALHARNSVVSGGDLGRPTIAAEVPSGQYLVAWSQTPTGDATRDIFARRLNSNAFPYGPLLKIEASKAPVDDVYPSLGSLEGYGGFVIAWERRDGAGAPDIQTRRLNRNGSPYRSDYALAGGPAFSFAPDVSSTERESTLIVWIDRNAAGDHSIVGAEVSRTGQRRGPERLIVQGGAGPGALTPIVPGPNPGGPTVPPLPTPMP